MFGDQESMRALHLLERILGALRMWRSACPYHAKALVFPSQTRKALSHAVVMTHDLQPIHIAARVKIIGEREDEAISK